MRQMQRSQRRFNLKSCLAITTAVVLTALSVQQANADGVVSSDFIFQMSNAFFQAPEYDFSQDLAQTETVSLPDTVVQDLLPVTVSGISATVSYALNSSASHFALGSNFTLTSNQVSVAINIHQISVNGWVVQNVGGITVRAYVQGSCSNIPVTLAPGQASVTGVVATGVDNTGLPLLTLSSLDAEWNQNSWSVGQFSCTSTAGLQDRVISGLKSYLANPAGFQAQLGAMVSQRLTQYQATLRTAFLQSKTIPINLKGIQLTLTPQAIINLQGDSFQVHGQLAFTFPSTTVNQQNSVVVASAAPASMTGYSLMVPEGLVAALNKMAFLTGDETYRQPGQGIAAFKNFLQNGFAEFFVWPELLYYSSQTAFLFDFFTSKVPTLSALTDQKNGTLLGKIAGELDVTMWAPIRKAYVKMVDFVAPMTGTYQLSFSDGAQSSEVNLNMTIKKMDMNLSANYDSAYQQYLRNPYIDVGTLQSNVLASAVSENLQVPIQSLQMTSVLSLVPSGLSLQGSWIAINWKTP